MRHRAGRAVAVAALLAGLQVGPARAQWSGAVAWESDHRFRGVSLSGDRPTARLDLAWEATDGSYAGASLAALSPEAGPRRPALLGYVGHAWRGSADWAVELGATLSHFAADRGYDYGEVFAGLVAPRWSARLYLSPDYFGRGRRSAYAELNAGWPLLDQGSASWTLVAHVGALHVFDPDEAGNRTRRDLRLGVTLGFVDSGLELQAAWVASRPAPVYGPGGEQSRNRAVFGASWAF